MKLVIIGTLPSTNEILAASNNNRYKYNDMKRSYTDMVAWQAKSLPNLEPSDYVITWYCPNMKKDKDNIMGGQKFIFDGLVKSGRLPNDGWKDIGDISHKFKVDKINPRIEIDIILREVS